ncbi:MAG: extracytoplasmic sigma factor ECF [Planctomycetota bacterium]|nr:MAG: extracytoplasmic sigma factor ECF [Planctomycetota bacterium]
MPGARSTRASLQVERADLREDPTVSTDRNLAFDAALPEFYDELRRVAARQLAREAPRASLQPTLLAHEAYLRLARQRSELLVERSYVMAAAASVIRRLLVDHARARKRLKRGGDWTPIPLENLELPGSPACDVVELDDALDTLRGLHPRQARVVELRFFGELSISEVSTTLGVSTRTVNDDWRMARAWLRTQLDDARPR